ncbi:hypothetical protein EJV47_23480 [Hymenobacter gummosus]|uniref:Uncharacterized protein n=1 Tax=Hymenobacter gummosus TaxID=1776032 RepID=A0A3S0H5U0_9BACT|nr:hypothetical protein [Hymenobacter gummosus]RTQ45801.1 hypothetical protein EJV47_23480 [Hymenobacter gummosus]
MEEPTVMGFYDFPRPHGTRYYAADLATPEQVQGLFDYCQILRAHITAAGWIFLLERYGLAELYRLDRQSGWYDDPTLLDYCVTLRDLHHIPLRYLTPLHPYLPAPPPGTAGA